MAGRRGAAEVSDVRVTGRDGSTALVRVTVPAPECPPAEAPVEKFDDSVRKSVIHTMMHPESLEALREGLCAPKLEERRRWWQLGLQHILPLLGGGNAPGGQGGVKIVFDQRVPKPAHEDGPIGERSTIDVTPDD